MVLVWELFSKEFPRKLCAGLYVSYDNMIYVARPESDQGLTGGKLAPLTTAPSLLPYN